MSYRIKKVLMNLYLTIHRKRIVMESLYVLDYVLGDTMSCMDAGRDSLNELYDQLAYRIPSWILETTGLNDPRKHH